VLLLTAAVDADAISFEVAQYIDSLYSLPMQCKGPVFPRQPIAPPYLHRFSIYNRRTMASSRLADQLGVVLTRLINVLREAVLPSGMNSAQARTLLALHDAGPQRVTDLARLDHLKQPTMSAVLIRMERLGWVRRRDDDDDLRAVIVDITEQGEQVALELIASRSCVLESYLETLSAADRASVAAALPALRKLTRKRPPRG
jgi:DNA-binding MarR family transcriptional regulator